MNEANVMWSPTGEPGRGGTESRDSDSHGGLCTPHCIQCPSHIGVTYTLNVCHEQHSHGVGVRQAQGSSTDPE